MHHLVALLLLSPALAIQRLSHEEQFLRFKQKFAKVYSSEAEERLRFAVFKENVAAVEEHNAGVSTYTKGVNEWSDLRQEEWEAMFLGGYRRMGPSSRTEAKAATTQTRDLPASVDWREEGVITDVKNQGQCGSCWAFGATEQIESYTALASGSLVELAPQQITSCVPNPLNCGGTGGCQGSTPPLAYSYVQLFGQVSEADYPYVSGTTTDSEDCNYDLNAVKPVATITGYNNLPPNDQAAVMDHIAHVGPLAISVYASTFKDYHGGVFSGCPYDENIGNNHEEQLGRLLGRGRLHQDAEGGQPAVRHRLHHLRPRLPERPRVHGPAARVRDVRDAPRDLLPPRSTPDLGKRIDVCFQ